MLNQCRAQTAEGGPEGTRLGTFRLGPAGATRWLVGIAVLVLGLLAWRHRFVQDDAFISFRYARNLVEGHGLVFNPGEPVEGYTNFLWTLLMAAGLRLRIPVVLWSQLLGLACFGGSLVLTFWLARRLLRSSRWGLLAMVLLGLNFSFSAYATGGLETSLQTMSVLLATCLAWAALDREQLRPRDLALFSVVAALALMTRLDSLVLLLLPAGALLWRTVHAPADGAASRARLVLALVLPAGILLGAWFAWKLRSYGALLPLTFDVKTGGDFRVTLRQGLRFLFEFARSYWLAPLLVLVLVFAPRLWRARELRPLLLTCILWIAYVIGIGGDFMEFRLLVPLLPLWTITVLAVPALALRIPRRALATAGLVALTLAGSWHHQATFKVVAGIESVRGLSRHLGAQRWVRIGEVLGEAFADHADEVTLAVTAAGAIPFHSRMRTVDMLGLNDPVVARQGIAYKSQPGHERIASFAHLLGRGVNLVVGHPVVVPQGWRPDPARPFDLRLFRILDARPSDLPPSARLLEIPLDQENTLLVLYLASHPSIDRAILARSWQTLRIP